MAIDLIRLEVWTDFECAGGTRVGFYQPLPVSARLTQEINGEHGLKVQLYRDVDAWAYIQRDRVLRAHLRNGAYHELRISDVGEAHHADGRLVAEVAAGAPLYDLGHDLVAHHLENGDVLHDFPLPFLTPTEHLNVILGKTSGFSSPAAGWWAVGTVDFTDRVDINYRGLTALEAVHELVKKLADPATGIGAEFEVTRNGTSGYVLHLRQRIATTAERAYFRYARNVHTVQKAEVAEDVPTRVYPFGQELEGVRFDMGDAQWEVSAVDGNDVTLGDSPIAFDDQLNGLYLERPDGTLIQINDTTASTQKVTLASTPGLGNGDLVWIRRNSDGDELTYLDRPGQTRIRQERLERPDLPPVDNLVTNPFFNDWSGSDPVGWSSLNGATITQVNEGGKVQNGLNSAQIVTLSEEGGIETDWIDVYPNAARPFFLSQVALYPVEGVWRFEIECDDGGDGFIIPDDVGAGARAYTSILNAWVESLTIQDQGTNFFDRGVTRVKLRCVADQLDAGSGQASCYFDAGQLVQTSLPELPFYGGRASRGLWHAANRRLTYVDDGAFKLDVSIVDLHRLDETGFPHDELVVGGTVEVQDPALGLVTETRIRRVAYELMQPGASEVQLSDRPDELVDISRLPLERRVGRLLPGGGGGGASKVDGNPVLDEDDGVLYLHPRRLPGALSIGYYDSDSVIDDATLLNNLVASNLSDLNVHTFSADGEKRYVSLAYFPGADAAGKVGAIHHLTPYEYSDLDNLPVVTYQVIPAPDKEYWRILLTVVDDGDAVYAEHRHFEEGSTPPSYTRNPTSGTVSDPHSFSFDVPKPASDSDPDYIVHAYGYDGSGNRSRLLFLRVKRHQVVSGNDIKSLTLTVVPDVSSGTPIFRAAMDYQIAEGVQSLSVVVNAIVGDVGVSPVFDVDVSGDGRYLVPLVLNRGYASMSVVVTPYDAAGGAAGSGNPGPSVRREVEDGADTGAATRAVNASDPSTKFISDLTQYAAPLKAQEDVNGRLLVDLGDIASLTELDPADPSSDWLVVLEIDGGGSGIHLVKKVRPANLGVGSGTIDHGDLDGLEDDDHPQYAKKASSETISDVWTFSATPKMDAIDERTVGAGVTIDGVECKDGVVTASDEIATDSDVHLKREIRRARWMLLRVLRIGARFYKWRPRPGIPDLDIERVHLGFLAQEVAAELPWAFRVGGSGSLQVVPVALLAALWQAFTELVVLLFVAFVGVVLCL